MTDIPGFERLKDAGLNLTQFILYVVFAKDPIC